MRMVDWISARDALLNGEVTATMDRLMLAKMLVSGSLGLILFPWNFMIFRSGSPIVKWRSVYR